MAQLILASGSPYRQQLLARLGLPFDSFAPQIDESSAAGELPSAMARRLAREKAAAVAKQIDSGGRALIVGSDQVAELAGQTLGKPGDFATAVKQLSNASGQTLLFHTAVCLLDSDSEELQEACVTTRVTFRALTPTQIEHYLAREQPYDCAGSFKAEGLGITLFESIISEDPTALIGLPLIRLTAMLQHAGVDPLAQGATGENS